MSKKKKYTVHQGRIGDPDGKYTIKCISCKSSEDLIMIPHRSYDESLCGWIFACKQCAPHLYDGEVVTRYSREYNP